jgi:hypothetical protein
VNLKGVWLCMKHDSGDAGERRRRDRQRRVYLRPETERLATRYAVSSTVSSDYRSAAVDYGR